MALGLVVIMLFSMFAANLSSIVSLLSVSAIDIPQNTKKAKLTLYDYYSDTEGSSRTATSLFKNFNTALFNSGYATKAGSSDTTTNTNMWNDGKNNWNLWQFQTGTFTHGLKYFPLYLGNQYNSGSSISDNGISRDEGKYNYT